MSKRPQFSLKAILVIITVLAVPLGMMVSGVHDLVQIGGTWLFPVLFGCIGYLLLPHQPRNASMMSSNSRVFSMPC